MTSDNELYTMIQQYDWICYIIHGLNDSLNWITKDKFYIIDNKLMITEEDGSIIYIPPANTNGHQQYNIIRETLQFIYDILHTNNLNILKGYTKGHKAKGQIFGEYYKNWIYLQILFYKLQ